jgi:hypothetical protein
VIPEFDGRTTKNQKPQNNHQRQIKTAEPAGIERGESEIHRSAHRDQPHFVSIPHRADARQNLPPLFIRLRHPKMDRASS